MSFYLEMQKTTSTPYILVDEAKGYMKMEGKSFPEKAAEFFSDVNTWLDSYLETEFSSLVFDFVMEYYNSSTLKIIMDMMLKMDKYSVGKNKIVINWIAADDDDIAIESGEDIKEDMVNLEFNVIIDEGLS